MADINKTNIFNVFKKHSSDFGSLEHDIKINMTGEVLNDIMAPSIFIIGAPVTVVRAVRYISSIFKEIPDDDYRDALVMARTGRSMEEICDKYPKMPALLRQSIGSYEGQRSYASKHGLLK